MGNDLKLPETVPSHCTVVGPSSKNNVIESGNPSQRLPLINHINYSVVYCPCSQYTQWVQLVLCSSGHFDCCGVCTGVGSDCSMKCAVMLLFVMSHWCEPDVSWMQF